MNPTIRGQQQPRQQQQPGSNILTTILSLITIILRILLKPLKLITNTFFPYHEYDGLSNSDKAAQNFSSQHNSFFFPQNYTKIIQEAHSQNKFLVIVLHSSLHPMSETFLNLLTSPPSSENTLSPSTIMTDCLKWGGDVQTHAEAYKLSKELNVAYYPFCALCVCTSRSTMEIVYKYTMQLPTSDDICAKIGTAIATHAPIIMQEQERRTRREEEIRLRQEQDYEYQQTLLEDQRRDAERRERLERERAEEENQRRQEELASQREAQRLQEARDYIPSEPAKTDANAVRFRIMFPSGSKIERRFIKENTIRQIKAFVFVYMQEKEMEIVNFELEMNYPKKRLDEVDKSIEECGLGKMAVLMVVDLDS